MNVRYPKERRSKLLRAFLITSIVFSLIGLGNLLSVFFVGSPLVVIHPQLNNVLSVCLLILSVVCLVMFKRQGMSTLTLILPMWTIMTFVVSIVIGLVFVPIYLKYNLRPEVLVDAPAYKIVNIILTTAYICVASYLIYMFRQYET